MTDAWLKLAFWNHEWCKVTALRLNVDFLIQLISTPIQPIQPISSLSCFYVGRVHNNAD